MEDGGGVIGDKIRAGHLCVVIYGECQCCAIEESLRSHGEDLSPAYFAAILFFPNALD